MICRNSLLICKSLISYCCWDNWKIYDFCENRRTLAKMRIYDLITCKWLHIHDNMMTILMLVIMMWLIVRLLCELCIMRRCCYLVVIIVDDLMTLFCDDDLLFVFMDVNTWWCNGKYWWRYYILKWKK